MSILRNCFTDYIISSQEIIYITYYQYFILFGMKVYTGNGCEYCNYLVMRCLWRTKKVYAEEHNLCNWEMFYTFAIEDRMSNDSAM